MRALATVVVLAVVFWGADSMPSDPIHPDLDNFKKRIRYDALVGTDAPSGVVVDWGLVPSVLSKTVQGMKLEISSSSVTEPGLAQASWIWKDDAKDLAVAVQVSGTGPRRAREKLLAAASATMMVTIPYEPGPRGLGDLSVRNLGEPLRHVYWVFHNVLVEVESEGGHTPVEPVARAIETLMESHVVLGLAEHLPPIEQVEPSRSRVTVGQSVTFHIRTRAAGDSLIVASHEVGGPHFTFRSATGLEQTYTADSVGRATFEPRIADRKTLLSPALSPVVVEVVGAGSP
jgi:hypothetical protein